MHVAAAWVEIHIPSSHSLKEKRRVVRSLVDRIRARYRISAAEVGGQGTWQSATVGLCCVSGSPGLAEDLARKVLRFCESCPDFEVVEWAIDSLKLT